MCYGGDYNPDQWCKTTWQEDMRLLKLAGVNILTVPVFSWANLQTPDEQYHFEWLDEVLQMAQENDMHICLATSTAAQPAWMSLKYPDMLPVDFEGKRRQHGGRVKFCPTNEKYRELSVKLATALAQRYQHHEALLLWHIGNEYDNYCYCEHCAQAFRDWVKKKYGTIEELNNRWYMHFWGHTLYSFDEIVVPSGLSEMWIDNGKERSTFQSISLDYKRFMNEVILECYEGEYKAIKAITPKVPITTNFMGTFKPLDYFKWAEKMDIISWDNYPSLVDEPYKTAMRHDLMRGLKGGQPFMLMEQTPNAQNWQPYNSLKRPGVMRLQSYQAVAHGADTVMFFQMRRSRGACEKYHSAVIDHAGHEHTRVFRECAALGEELRIIGDQTLGSRTPSKVAIIFDWENWWAIELSSGPTIELNYLAQVEKYYKAFHQQGIGVDFVASEGDLSKYELVVAPVLYMVKPGVADGLEKFVEAGGTLVTTFFSGIVNENDLVTLGGYPGELRDLLGIWVEEIDALFPHMKNEIVMKGGHPNFAETYSCNMLCEVLHLEAAEALATYGQDFYAGSPVLTVNQWGKGKAYYIAANPEDGFVVDLIKQLCEDKGISAPLTVPVGVEVTHREKDGSSFLFVLNHNNHVVQLELTEKYCDLITSKTHQGIMTLKSKDVMILKG